MDGPRLATCVAIGLAVDLWFPRSAHPSVGMELHRADAHGAFWALTMTLLAPFILLDAVSFVCEMRRWWRGHGPTGVLLVALIIYALILGPVTEVLCRREPLMRAEAHRLLVWLVVYHALCHGIPIVVRWAVPVPSRGS